MARVYADLIRKGRKTLEGVPPFEGLRVYFFIMQKEKR